MRRLEADLKRAWLHTWHNARGYTHAGTWRLPPSIWRHAGDVITNSIRYPFAMPFAHAWVPLHSVYWEGAGEQRQQAEALVWTWHWRNASVFFVDCI